MRQPFTFNGKELPEYVRVTGIELPVTPDISGLTRTVPRMFGEIDTGTQIKGGEFKFDIALALTPQIDIHTAIDQLKDFLKGDNYEESKLVFREQPNKYYMARMVGSTNMKDLFVYGEGSFTLHATKLIKYEDKEQTTSGGSINYLGTLKSSPVLDITLSSSFKNIVITHMQSNRKMTLVGDFSENTKIQVDTGRKLVKVSNQLNNKVISLDSDWVELQSGNNTITVTSGAGGGSASVSVKYRNKWG